MLTKLEHILLLMGFQPQPAVFKWNTIQTSLDKSVVKRPSPITAPPSAFAAMLERHSSFCTEMMRWPHLSRWDQLRSFGWLSAWQFFLLFPQFLPVAFED
jgi:hypothetical protein